jgi:hypothetical protein
MATTNKKPRPECSVRSLDYRHTIETVVIDGHMLQNAVCERCGGRRCLTTYGSGIERATRGGDDEFITPQEVLAQHKASKR